MAYVALRRGGGGLRLTVGSPADWTLERVLLVVAVLVVLYLATYDPLALVLAAPVGAAFGLRWLIRLRRRRQRGLAGAPSSAARRAYEGQEWAVSDARWIAVWVSLLGATALWPQFAVPLVLYTAFWGVRLAVLAVRRRRLERETDATSVFWADRLKP
jgi:hypothetical protein